MRKNQSEFYPFSLIPPLGKVGKTSKQASRDLDTLLKKISLFERQSKRKRKRKIEQEKKNFHSLIHCLRCLQEPIQTQARARSMGVALGLSQEAEAQALGTSPMVSAPGTGPSRAVSVRCAE